MWDDLSMTERAKYIGLAVQSGITDPSIIRSRYNSFARGGYTKWKEAIQRHKGIQIDGDDTYDYVSFYNDDPDRAWDMLNKDSKSHFVDDYKTVKHPSFSVESKYSSSPDNLLNINKYNPLGITGGTWRDNGYTYQLSEDQVNTDWDTDRTYDYFEEAEPHPMSIMSPDGANYLRSITVTPKKNKFGEGGDEDTNRFITTGNEYGDLAASFVPGVGAAMDIETAIRNPSIGNWAWAVGSTALDLMGGSIIKGALKTAKAATRGVRAMERAEKAAVRLEKTTKAVNKNPTRGTRQIRKRAFDEYNNAKRELHDATITYRTRGLLDRKPYTVTRPPVNLTPVINKKTVLAIDAITNGLQNYIN
jgi:hypothetical protein